MVPSTRCHRGCQPVPACARMLSIATLCTITVLLIDQTTAQAREIWNGAQDNIAQREDGPSRYYDFDYGRQRGSDDVNQEEGSRATVGDLSASQISSQDDLRMPEGGFSGVSDYSSGTEESRLSSGDEIGPDGSRSAVGDMLGRFLGEKVGKGFDTVTRIGKGITDAIDPRIGQGLELLANGANSIVKATDPHAKNSTNATTKVPSGGQIGFRGISGLSSPYVQIVYQGNGQAGPAPAFLSPNLEESVLRKRTYESRLVQRLRRKLQRLRNKLRKLIETLRKTKKRCRGARDDEDDLRFISEKQKGRKKKANKKDEVKRMGDP